MVDKTSVEPISEQRPAARPASGCPDLAAPSASAEVTKAYESSTKPEDTPIPPAPASEPPAVAAEQSVPVRHKSLTFLQPGTRPGSLGRLGHFEVLELLGKGGFGIVLKALDDKLQRLAAIKVLGPQLTGSATARSRFVREARAAAAVNHKYVVSIYEVYEQPIPYLVMEYVAGKSLQERLDQLEPFAPRDILRIGAEIAEGLAAAHQQGLIHRDIKPANVLLEGEPGALATGERTPVANAPGSPRVKIADFGLARAVDDVGLTQSGMIAGTPLFMSPEQARGEPLDHRSDLFSLGSVLYALCTGHSPFQAHKALGVLKRVCDDTPRPIREINPAIPEALAAVINRLLVKDPAGRFQTAAAVAELLAAHLAHLGDPALPAPSVGHASGETPDQVPAESAQSNAVPAPTKRARPGRKWVIAAAALLLPVLALTLTETAGVTHWFRGGRALTDPDTPGSEPTAAVANPETPLAVAPLASVPAEKPLPRAQEKPIEKIPLPLPAATEDNPFQKAKVGDWAEYKMTQVGNGTKIDGKIKMEVTARTEKTAKVKRTLTTAFGQNIAYPEQEIDLTKPYDPTNTTNLPRGADVKVEKGESGTEKIKFGDKEYETSWAKRKVTAKFNGRDQEAHFKYWTSRSGPLGGLVKMETTTVVTIGAKPTEAKTTLELTRSGSKVHLIEARSSAGRGDWNAAVAAYARYFAVQELEDGEVGFEYATVLLLAGDQPGYRNTCAEMLAHGGKPDIRPYHVARAWTLAPDSGKDTALAGQRADSELKRSGREFWSLTEQGALLYRAGRYDAVATLLQQSLKADSRPDRVVLNWLWLALVEERRGKPVEALAWLEKATKWLERNPRMPPGPNDTNGVHLHNWLEAQVLHREAERALALAKRVPALLRGEDKPNDNAERLAFAQLTHAHKHFAAAARLWAEALQADPKVAEDRQKQPRYKAACAAALAVAGQGKEEPPLDDAAKTKLRGQALDWLKAELNAWDRLLESGPTQDRPTVEQTLSHWQKETDLASIRDEAALAKLPAEEQKAFAQFWADVAALLKKVKEKAN